MIRFKKIANQSDISKLTGVAKSTVSMALNGNPKIKKETRDLILKAAKQLNYSLHDNTEARHLVAKRTGKPIRFESIGLIWPKNYAMHDDPFYLTLLHGFIEGCWDIQCSLTLININVDNLENIEKIASLSHIDGLIIPIPSNEHLAYAHTLNLPLITTYFERPELASVSIDHAEVIDLAFQYIYDNGHRKIAYIAPDLKVSQSMLRWQTYCSNLEQKGLPYNANLVICKGTSDAAEFGEHNFIELWKHEHPSAVIAYNDRMAVGILKAAKYLGLKVGKDVSVISIDDSPEAATTDPSLTTISVGLKEIGRQSAILLNEFISQKTYTAKHVQMPVKIIERKSVLKI